jgi:hypothetical protein
MIFKLYHLEKNEYVCKECSRDLVQASDIGFTAFKGKIPLSLEIEALGSRHDRATKI